MSITDDKTLPMNRTLLMGKQILYYMKIRVVSLPRILAQIPCLVEKMHK